MIHISLPHHLMSKSSSRESLIVRPDCILNYIPCSCYDLLYDEFYRTTPNTVQECRNYASRSTDEIMGTLLSIRWSKAFPKLETIELQETSPLLNSLLPVSPADVAIDLQLTIKRMQAVLNLVKRLQSCGAHLQLTKKELRVPLICLPMWMVVMTKDK